MAEQLGWREAIIRVLSASLEPMHYEQIAEEIEAKGFRTKLGATPANSVNVVISDSLKKDGAGSIFERVARGVYRMRTMPLTESMSPKLQIELAQEIAQKEALLANDESAEESAGLINAFGMYWARDKILWNVTVPKLFGKQSANSEAVDFTDQRGVYLLYDRNIVIYVGRAIDQGIGTRLRQHTTDRLNGRWDRFSWFGIYSVSDTGKLESKEKPYTAELLIATMEALLIESVEPAQNRRRGDDFKAVEFLQEVDPEMQRALKRQMLRSLEKDIG